MSNFSKKRKRFQRNSFRTSFKKKRKSQLNTNDIKHIFVVLFLLFSISFYYFIILSDYFKIQNIEINQTKIISKNNLENFIFENISSQRAYFWPHNNIFLLSVDDLQKSLVEKFSQIDNIDISKKLPQSLLIKITEKNPLILWCRFDKCFYLDKNGVVFAREADVDNSQYNQKFIKIIEEKEIEEEMAEEKETIKLKEAESNTKQSEEDEKLEENMKTEQQEKEVETIANIFLGEKVTDEQFIKFAEILNENIRKSSEFKVKYYKTKGTKTRELIAYTDKNIRIYFVANEDPLMQLSYLKDFLSSDINEVEINSLSYIYVKSGNKIFYK